MPRLRATAVHRDVQRDEARRVLLQGPRLLSVVSGPKDVRNSGAPDGRGDPARGALASVGADDAVRVAQARGLRRSAVVRVFTKEVSRFYGKHNGAVVALQRTSSDMKLNPHVHAVFLDGHYVERQGEFDFETRSRLSTTDVANVLEKTRDKMFAYLRRRKMLAVGADDTHEMTPLAASAVAGTSPPTGPEWRRGTLPLTHQAMKTGRPLCVALDGFTLHAATRHRSDG